MNVVIERLLDSQDWVKTKLGECEPGDIVIFRDGYMDEEGETHDYDTIGIVGHEVLGIGATLKTINGNEFSFNTIVWSHSPVGFHAGDIVRGKARGYAVESNFIAYDTLMAYDDDGVSIPLDAIDDARLVFTYDGRTVE